MDSMGSDYRGTGDASPPQKKKNCLGDAKASVPLTITTFSKK